MKPITPHKKRSKEYSLLSFPISLALWLVIWEIASLLVGRKLFLPSPVDTLCTFFKLCTTLFFWQCVANSVTNILIGFILAVIIGIFLATVAYFIPALRHFLSIPMTIIRAVPVASFIILALLWLSSKNISILISFLMATPVIYFAVLSGLSQRDENLLQMAVVFGMSLQNKLRAIYLPAAVSSIKTAISTALGLAWKSGIAAEVIGIARNTIGNELNKAKIYLETEELFAWTLTVIILSFVFEKILMFILRDRRKS